jgi:exonuclease III
MQDGVKRYLRTFLFSLNLGLLLLVGTLHFIYQLGIYQSNLLTLMIVILPHLYTLLLLISLGLWLDQKSQKNLILLWTHLFIVLFIWGPSWFDGLGLKKTKDVSQQDHLKILTWNVGRMGELTPDSVGFEKKQMIIEEKVKCVSDLLVEKKVDLIAFQEISNVRIKDLKKKLEMKCRFIDYFGIGQDSVGGIAICVPHWSSWSLSFSKNVKILDRWRSIFSEVQHIEGHRKFNLLNIHLTSPKIQPHELSLDQKDLKNLMQKTLNTLETHDKQYENIIKSLSSFQDPTLLAGDFNSPPEAIVHQKLSEGWMDIWRLKGQGMGATRYFANLVPFRIDYIYAKNDQWKIHQVEVIPKGCSDHFPVYGELSLLE